MTVRRLKVSRQSAKFDLFEELVGALQGAGLTLQNGDVLVVSSKYLAISQGRQINLKSIAESADAKALGRAYCIAPKVAEVVLRESDLILGGAPRFALASSGGIIAPNAGVDRSNAGDGTIVLYPQEPHAAAEQLRRKSFLKYSVCIGVVISDSRLMPGRVGTVGVAVASAGVDPVSDMRGRLDLDGLPLKITLQATADSLATAANYAMGEGDQSTPMALVSDSGAKIISRRVRSEESVVDSSQCVYIRALDRRSFETTKPATRRTAHAHRSLARKRRR